MDNEPETDQQQGGTAKAPQTADAFFAERKGRGDKEAAIRFLTRADGERPCAGDELPDLDNTQSW